MALSWHFKRSNLDQMSKFMHGLKSTTLAIFQNGLMDWDGHALLL
jgi:hypothetical protein